MSDQYRGDTVGKKISRFMAWKRVIEMNSERKKIYPSFRALYLASKEGGDASVLSVYGVSPKKQLAVDIDEDALTCFSAKHPDVPTHHGDVSELVFREHERFSAIYLDFCTHLSDSLVTMVEKTIVNCMHTHGGSLAVAFLRGREKNKTFSDVQRKMGAASLGGTLLVDEDAESRGLSDGRLDFFGHNLNARLQVHNLIAISSLVLTYQSRTDESPGVPMAINLFYILPFWKKRGWTSKKHSHGGNGRSSIENADRIRDCLLEAANSGKHGLVCESIDFSDRWTQEHLRIAALTILQYHSVREVALGLNIDPRTVAAWKAHQTMGTYGP